MAQSKVPAGLIATAAITAASGGILWVKGLYELRTANTRIRKAGERYDTERRKLENDALLTNEALRALGARQDEANHVVIERMVDFLRRHEKEVAESDKLFVDGVDTALAQVALGKGLGQDAVSWLRGLAGTAITGVGVNAGITTVVTTWAAASTGTAISSLSGAAATNATLAFLGGGSLASGGGGVALGATVLNVVTIGPAILVSGFVVAGQGEKAKTKALQNEAAVNVAIAELGVTKTGFDAIRTRAEELESLLEQLVQRASSALDLLESEPLDLDRHGDRFGQALTLTFAVRDVASAQVVNASGELDEGTATFKVRYRPLIKEPADG